MKLLFTSLMPLSVWVPGGLRIFHALIGLSLISRKPGLPFCQRAGCVSGVSQSSLPKKHYGVLYSSYFTLWFPISILNDTLLKILESFQADIGRLPKHTLNRVIRIALRWPSVRARVLFSKLAFLWKPMTSNDSLSSKVEGRCKIFNCSDDSFHLGLHLHSCRSAWSTF